MAEGKQRGRPPKAAGEAKRASFNTRLRPGLKAVLEECAKREGRSLSEEIEFRLEQSLERERWLGDWRTNALLRVLADLVQLESGKRHWLDDYYAFGAVTDLWRGILEKKRPPVPEEITRRIEDGKATLERLNSDDLGPDHRARLQTVIGLLASDQSLPEAVRAEFSAALAAHSNGKG